MTSIHYFKIQTILKKILFNYLDCFSDNVKDIFINFDIKNQIAKLSKANLLYLLIKKFSETNVDLSPKNISNHEIGTLFEELIRKSLKLLTKKLESTLHQEMW